MVLNVGGAGLSQMMTRARPFAPFIFLLQAIGIEDPLTQHLFFAVGARHFDRIDGATYAPWLRDEPLAGSPSDRQVLLQIGLGDTEVPNHTAYLHARALGLGVVAPAPRHPWGLDEVEAPASGMTLFDFGIDTAVMAAPFGAEVENEVHEGVRLLPAAQAQMDAFFRPKGRIIPL